MSRLPEPRLTRVYRLDAALGEPLDLGDVSHGHRRIVLLTGGTFTGPELNGKLLPGASADWQVVHRKAPPSATSATHCRPTTASSSMCNHEACGTAAPRSARLGRGDDVDASEYTFRTSTQIETASRDLDWLNKGVFVSVGGRRPGGVVYETYLVA